MGILPEIPRLFAKKHKIFVPTLCGWHPWVSSPDFYVSFVTNPCFYPYSAQCNGGNDEYSSLPKKRDKKETQQFTKLLSLFFGKKATMSGLPKFWSLFCIKALKKIAKNSLCFQKKPSDLDSPLIVAAPYGVATISRLLKIIGLFCRISSLL